MDTPIKTLKRNVSCSYNKVYVIHSLPREDARIAEETHSAIQFKLMIESRFSVELKHATTGAELLTIFREIAQQAEDGELPILHLEIHGEPTGLITANGDFIPWKDIANSLRAINSACGHNLLVTLAVCNGAHLWTTVDVKLRAPFWGIIGPTKEISNGEIESLFPEFYRRLLGGENFDSAVQLLIDSHLKSGAKFQFQVSENIFLEQFQSFNNRLLDFDRFSQYQGKVTNRATRRQLQDTHKKTALRALKQEFYKYKNVFFMEDLYPENRNRFDFTYEDTRALSQFEFMYHPDLPIPENLRPY